MKFKFSSFNNGHIQDVIDEFEEVFTRSLNVVYVFVVLIVTKGAKNLLSNAARKPDYSVQGGAKFVAHAGQEFTFRRVGGPGFFQCYNQLTFNFFFVSNVSNDSSEYAVFISHAKLAHSNLSGEHRAIFP